MDEFIGEFIVETQEELTALDNALVTFAAQPDDKALLDKIFRMLHTIKGTCGFLGLSRLEKVAHIAETLLDKFRKGERAATPDDVNLVLRAMDQIRFLVDAIGNTGHEPTGDDGDLIASIQAAIDGAAPVPKPSGTDDAGPSGAAPADGAGVTAAAGDMPSPVVLPAPATAAPSSGHGVEQQQANQFLRIHVDTLEDMLAMVSELVLTRNQLSQTARALENEILDAPLQRLDSVVADLQDSVMKARMQPIGNAWAKLPRIIHDIGRETGKTIQLVMRGEETEVDRQILDAIKDPLMHMVRNSADHGIESPADRVAAGKGAMGTVTLSARHERGHVVIEIRDDGKGLSPDKIKKTVLARGLASEEHLATLPDRQVLSYIFAPGFSTAEKVTAISGRGVGMDVVRTNIEKLGGAVDLESTVGQGTCFTIRIPLTLAIISTLLVRVNDERYAVPQLSVQELIRVNAESDGKIELVGDCPVYRLREYLLPLVNPNGLMRGENKSSIPDDCYIVVIHAGATRFGLIVDGIEGTEEVVVKPVPSALRNMTCFSGNTILGDGHVIMILDPGGIAAHARLISQGLDLQPAQIESAPDDSDHTALLVFHAENDTPKAVPAFLVTRIVEFERESLERTGQKTIVQYQGRLVELHTLGDMPQGDILKVLLFSDDREDRSFGIIINAVNDIVTAAVEIDSTGRRPVYLGTAIVAGRATDILDINHFTGDEGWLPTDMSAVRDFERRRVLLVDDSAFFRHMLQPLLNLAGYTVTVAPGPKSALALCERGMDFDMILSDIEMEEMDGLTFAETVKSGTRWKDIPMVALSSHATPQDKEKGYQKGFSAYVAKSDRDALLSTLRDVFEKSHGTGGGE